MADDFDVETMLEETYRRQVSKCPYCCNEMIEICVCFLFKVIVPD